MSDFIIYIIKVSCGMLLLFLFYFIFLRRDTYFTRNRWFLLFSLWISFLLPLFRIPGIEKGTENGFAVLLNVIEVGVQEEASSESIGWLQILLGIYLLGIFFFTFQFLKALISIQKIKRKCKMILSSNRKLAISPVPIAPFSFLGTIYIDEETLNDRSSEKILLHEQLHIEQNHSIDIIFSEIVKILCWFNPASWKIMSALKETHEYLADEHVKEQTCDPAGYFMLLSRNHIGVQTGLANHLNKSLTLKRLKMMKKARTGRLSTLKILPAIPLMALLIVLFSIKDSKGILNESALPYSLNNVENTTLMDSSPAAVAKHDEVDKQPEFPGGMKALGKFIGENVKYPKDAVKEGISGTVYVKFVVSKKGKIQKVEVAKSVHELLDAEAVRVISIMPKWIPGEKNGKKVNVEITLPIAFKLDEKNQ